MLRLSLCDMQAARLPKNTFMGGIKRTADSNGNALVFNVRGRVRVQNLGVRKELEIMANLWQIQETTPPLPRNLLSPKCKLGRFLVGESLDCMIWISIVDDADPTRLPRVHRRIIICGAFDLKICIYMFEMQSLYS